ncbi:MAG: HDOD domain-containing protein [bacterium]|nr:HDOD domain-containing protein [bacterium]
MNAVKTDKLKAGQRLAEEVRDINGRLLLAKGNEIQPNHIRIFKIWGISEVNVAGAPKSKDHCDSSLNPESFKQAQKNMKVLCRHVDLDHPAIKEIFKLAVQFRCNHNLVEEENNLPITEPQMPLKAQKLDFRRELNKKKIILPEIPSVVFELNEVIANPMASAEQIAEVVNRSPSLTALLLKIVNSSFYGLPSKIGKVSHAVTLIGTREISGLALGISILSIFKNIPKNIIDMYSFWKHSLACGIFSRVLAAHLNSNQTELLFVSGLLHDLGRLILYIHFPKESLNIITRSRNRSKLLLKEEKDYLGCDHAEVAKGFLKQWKLPLVLENNVYYHHNPSEAPQAVSAAIVHLADIIVNSLGTGSSGERYVPPLDNAAWEGLELPVSSFEKVIGQATHQFKALEAILHV